MKRELKHQVQVMIEKLRANIAEPIPMKRELKHFFIRLYNTCRGI